MPRSRVALLSLVFYLPLGLAFPTMQACLLLCLLTARAFASPFGERQVSDISVIGFGMTTERPTSTTTVLSTKTEYTVVTPLAKGAIVSVVPYTEIVSGSITELRSATVTLYPVTYATPSPSTSTSTTATSSSTKRNGAIAGGVVGAVIVAAIAVVLFMRFRNKRSPRHWRNRGPVLPWVDSDGGSGGGDVKRPPSPIIATIPSPTTAAPNLVREKHRSSPSDPGPSQYIEMEAKSP
ncbi:hypothetical protein IW261DRAFT_743344 [Armillaria novae-zelandiae]|uniref:Mid2 domain-containing protein n=1 Tax=Armillaria novae-zelandiae TaxID=153914 RepID=A0AA39UG10_9AGAR|nr:hypothetical protein IW261DRAFT_743344 [Armillaria novae-zelandiae]